MNLLKALLNPLNRPAEQCSSVLIYTQETCIRLIPVAQHNALPAALRERHLMDGGTMSVTVNERVTSLI